MKKLPIILVGLAVTAASCAPVAATITPQPRETPTTTSAPTAAAEAQDPPATATTRALSEADIIAPTPSGKGFQPQLGEVSVDLNEVIALLPRDAIPAVLPDRVPRIMVSAADAASMENGAQVIGLSINGESRAYPIPFLSGHEIVNDTVGGRHIAVTW